MSIVFCNSRRDAVALARNLIGNGVKATVLHGGLSQQRREKVMEEFHKGITRVLVATDVAARGLDIRSVTHVFNYNMPKSAEDYANRIGRTARAGDTGKAISLLSREDHDSFRRVVRGFSYSIEKWSIQDFKILPFNRHDDSRGFGDRRSFRREFRRNRYR